MEDVADQVAKLTNDLGEMVSRLNQAHEHAEISDSEFRQIEKIVDVLQRSLEYIDQNTTEITQSLAGVQHSVSRGSNFDAGGYGY